MKILKKIFIVLFFIFTSLITVSNEVKADSCTATVDVVFYIDTSGSMSTWWSSICSNITDIVNQVEAEGNTVNYKIYGLGTTRSCATSYISGHNESWGPATSWVANNYPWTSGAIKIAVPVSDECPYMGNGCNAQDSNSITQAITNANNNGVIVSPIVTGSGGTLAQNLADSTGGTRSSASTPSAIKDAMLDLIKNEIGDLDGDGYLSAICGGDDCNDSESSVYPGELCLNKCFDNTLRTGTCQAGTGDCSYDIDVMTCENLGSVCRFDSCQENSGGADTCIADTSESICGGMIPCGRMVDDPTTTDNDESETCSFCHLVLMLNNVIQYLVQIASVFALLMLIATGFLYIISSGNPDQRNVSKGYFFLVIKGFLIIMVSWLLVDFVLSAWGYLDPLGGQWNVVC